MPQAPIGVKVSSIPGPGPKQFHGLAGGQSGNGKHAHVEQGAEKCGKEHDFGKDEPAHAPAEGQIHLPVEFSALAFADHCAEPAQHHVDHDRHSGEDNPRACSNLIHPQYAAQCHEEQAT
jgi:hypothetical protein